MTNIKESIINHIDAGDLIGDILDAQDEFADDKQAFGVRVANLLNDFRDKVVDEQNERGINLPEPMLGMKEAVDGFFKQLADMKLKENKEWK